MISKAQQEETDFDWFGIDEDGYIGHFTTAGFKLLPRSVSGSAEDLKKVTDYFERLPPTGGYSIASELERMIGPFEDSKKKTRYLSSFSDMASRGLYSFDIDTYIRPGLAYFQVVAPLAPLRVDLLPADIRTIVGRTLLKGRLKETSQIDYEATLNI